MTRNAYAYLIVAASVFTLAILSGCGGGDFRDGDPDSMTRSEAALRNTQPVACDANPQACS